LVVRIAAIAAVVAGVVWMLRGIDRVALGDALARAAIWPLVIAAAINFGLIGCKAVAWRILLGPAYPVATRRLVGYTITSCAASAILPLRAGELVRVWLLRDRDGVPTSHAAAVAVAEKLLDVVAMLILVAPMPWLVRDLPAALGWWIGGLALAVIAALAGLRWAARSARDPDSWLGRFLAATTVVHRPRTFATVVAVLVASWLIDLAMIDLVLWAVGVDLPVGAGVLVLFGVNLTIAIPSTPGQLGALELGAVVALQLLHVDRERSLAFALLYHALQVIPIVVVGLAVNSRAMFARPAQRS